MIYLDNAATTYPKPQAVYQAADECFRYHCGNPGRGSHKLALEASEIIYECREALGELFNAKSENVVFTMNTTYALNIAIRAYVKSGMHVIISDIEHNSVYRPIAELARENTITYDIFKSGGSLRDVLLSIGGLIRPNTGLVVCAHSSNISNIKLPIREIGKLCEARGIKFIVDGAQSAGIYPIDMAADRISALCIPGHKGLYGMQGSGAVIFREDDEKALVFEGGNGINSLEPYMPDYLPERYEVGTLPTPSIAALYEGVKAVMREKPSNIALHESYLGWALTERLMNDRDITVYAPEFHGGIVLFNVSGMSSSKVCEALSKDEICVRSGFHCSPLCHRKLKTGDGGAVRVSLGMYNTVKDVLQLADAVARIKKTI